MKDEELQRVYQHSAALAPLGRCPEPEHIADLVQGVGTEPDRLAVLEHVSRCPTCRPELDLLRAANEGARAAEHGPRSSRWVALAAVALIGIGVGALALRGTRSAPPVEVMRGRQHTVSLLAPVAGASVARPVTLAWHAIDDAKSYRVELLTSRGDMIAAWSTHDTSFAIPDSIRLDSGVSYDVWVRAALADRTEVSSPVVRFNVMK